MHKVRQRYYITYTYTYTYMIRCIQYILIIQILDIQYDIHHHTSIGMICLPKTDGFNCSKPSNPKILVGETRSLRVGHDFLCFIVLIQTFSSCNILLFGGYPLVRLIWCKPWLWKPWPISFDDKHDVFHPIDIPILLLLKSPLMKHHLPEGTLESTKWLT